MDHLYGQIRQLSAELKAHLPMKAEYRRVLDEKFRLEFSFNSNQLEGNTLTYGETKLLLIFGETKNQLPHQLREYEEMQAHDVAFNLIREWAGDKSRSLTEADIKELNKIILVRPFWKDALTADGQPTRRLISVGGYKKMPNSVRLQNGEIFEYTSPRDTPIAMGELMDWYRQEEEKGELQPVELAALFHYKFVRIHPFDDGNGRISRLLMNYILLRFGLPPVVVKSADKTNYLSALHQADVGDLQAFIDYIAEQLIWSLEISIRAAKGESIDEAGDLDKRIVLLKKRMGGGAADTPLEKKGPGSIRLVVEKVVIPIAIAWEKRLKSLDAFFYSRNNVVFIDGHVGEGSDLWLRFREECQSFLYPRLEKGETIETIRLRCEPKGLKAAKKEFMLNGGELQVWFAENTYEISYSGGESGITRLYHEGLSAEEIGKIVDRLGFWLLDKIEKNFP